MEADEEGAAVLMAEDAPARAALLADLVAKGVPVAEFAVERKRLEDAYFEEMGQATGEGG